MIPEDLPPDAWGGLLEPEVMGPAIRWLCSPSRSARDAAGSAPRPEPAASGNQPRSSSPKRAQLSSIAFCAAGEIAPMSKKPWIIPS